MPLIAKNARSVVIEIGQNKSVVNKSWLDNEMVGSPYHEPIELPDASCNLHSDKIDSLTSHERLSLNITDPPLGA